MQYIIFCLVYVILKCFNLSGNFFRNLPGNQGKVREIFSWKLVDTLFIVYCTAYRPFNKDDDDICI